MNQSFKKWVGIGAGFGAGAVLMLVLAFLVFQWYTLRPKQWDERALRAKFVEPVYMIDEQLKVKNIELNYIVTNATPSDYTLMPDAQFMLQDRGALEENPRESWRQPACFLSPRDQTGRGGAI